MEKQSIEERWVLQWWHQKIEHPRFGATLHSFVHPKVTGTWGFGREFHLLLAMGSCSPIQNWART